MDLTNRVAVLTGGKRIGAVVAIEMARRGADIGLCYNRSRAEAETTSEKIKALGRRVFIKQANLTQAHDCELFVNESVAALGRLDVLINMASMEPRIPFVELTAPGLGRGDGHCRSRAGAAELQLCDRRNDSRRRWKTREVRNTEIQVESRR